MAAVGRVSSFGSSPPGLVSTYTGGPLANELTSGNGGAAAGDDEDGQNLWSCILSEVSTRSRSKLPAGKNVLLLGKCPLPRPAPPPLRPGSGSARRLARSLCADRGPWPRPAF